MNEKEIIEKLECLEQELDETRDELQATKEELQSVKTELDDMNDNVANAFDGVEQSMSLISDIFNETENELSYLHTEIYKTTFRFDRHLDNTYNTKDFTRNYK